MTALLLGTALLAGASAGAWLAYFRWKDKHHPEPLSVVLLAAAGGAVAVGGALLGYRTLQLHGVDVQWDDVEVSPLAHAAGLALLIGFVEEAAKALPVLAVARFTAHLDEEMDGFVYAGASGVGFALVEALFFSAPGAPLLEVVGRALASPITHALFAAPCGLGLARWQLGGKARFALAGFVASAAAHGGYDLLLARGAPRLLPALLVAALWGWLLVRVLRLQQQALRAAAPARPRVITREVTPD